MINKEQILSELDQSTNELIAQLQQCDEANFNKSPGANSWSAAQVAEHILLLETQVNRALLAADITERQIDLKIIPLKKGFENAEKKYVAPDFIIPSASHKNKQELIDGLKKQRDTLKQIIETTDLTHTPKYKHPVIGDMTRLEWVYFTIYHTERHLRQLQTIARQVTVEG
jgi:hypothetical protein